MMNTKALLTIIPAIFISLFANANPITLENTKIKLVTDGKHIISLYDKERQLEHISIDYTAAFGFFEVSYVNAATFQNVGTVNSGSITNISVLSSNPGSVSFELNDALLKAIVSISLNGEKAEAIWNIRIELKNNQYSVSQVDFPRLRTPQKHGIDFKRFFEPMYEGIFRTMQTAVNYPSRYPARLTLQMSGCFSPAGSFMLWTDDDEGNIKSFGFLNSGSSSNVAVRHLMPYEGQTWEASYNTRISLIGSMWQEAGNVYREWAHTQPWSATPLRNRTDVPAILHDVPLVISTQINKETFSTLPNRLKSWADKFDTRVIYRPTHWEKYDKWVGIDYFPVSIGNEAYLDLNTQLKASNITTAGFIESYHWTTRLTDGTTEQNNALASLFQSMNGNSLVKKQLNGTNYTRTFENKVTSFLCKGTDFGKTFLQGIAADLMDLGVSHIHNDFDWMVELGGPCFNKNHGHPVPFGTWEKTIMDDVYKTIKATAAQKQINNFFLTREHGFELQNMILHAYQERNNNIIYDKPDLVPMYLYVYHEFIPVIYGLVTANVKRNIELCALIIYGQIPSIAFWNAPAQQAGTNVMNEDTEQVLKDYYGAMKNHAKPYLLYGRLMPPLVQSGTGAIHNTWADSIGNQAVFAIDTLNASTTLTLKVPGEGPKYMNFFNGSSMVSSNLVTGGQTVNWTIPKWRLSSVVFTDFPYSVEKNPLPGNRVRVYPNPVEDILNISSNIPGSAIHVKVFDLTGKEITSFENKEVFNMENMKKGMYLFMVRVENTSTFHKVIKK